MADSIPLPLILMIQAAEDLVKRFPSKLNVISVTTETPVDSKLCKNFIQIPIDDLDSDNPVHQTLMGSKYKFATKKDIMDAVEFAKKHKVHIIHCGAGLSRSPAIAYAIFRSQGMNKETAMKEVWKRVPPAEPNRLIVRLTDEIFGV